MNEHPELWNMPWHARLKNLAEVAAVSGEFCFRVVRAQSLARPQGSAHAQSTVRAQNPVRAPSQLCAQGQVRPQSPVTPAGSWLGRARSRATPVHISAR
jgi:hypothetical protein